MKKSEFRTTEHLYLEAYKMMTFFEEVIEKLAFKQYDRKGLSLIRSDQKKEFYFIVKVNSICQIGFCFRVTLSHFACHHIATLLMQ